MLYIPPMSFGVWSRKEIGAAGESVAAEFLQRKGFEVVERNYRKPWGEIDIIAVKSDTVRFVEVKSVSRESIQSISRESRDYRPEELVHEHKLRKVARTAEMYMNEKNDPRDYQIDVVGVFLDMAKRKAKCRLFEQVL
jgi:putative endonuclease